MFENLLALLPQPTLFYTPGARLHFSNPLTTSPCSCCSTRGCVHVALRAAGHPSRCCCKWLPVPQREVKQSEKVIAGREANGPETGAEHPSQPRKMGCAARQWEGKVLPLIPTP